MNVSISLFKKNLNTFKCKNNFTALIMYYSLITTRTVQGSKMDFFFCATFFCQSSRSSFTQCWCISAEEREWRLRSSVRSQHCTDCDPECSEPLSQAAGSAHFDPYAGHDVCVWLRSHWSPILEPHWCSFGVCTGRPTGWWTFLHRCHIWWCRSCRSGPRSPQCLQASRGSGHQTTPAHQHRTADSDEGGLW